MESPIVASPQNVGNVLPTATGGSATKPGVNGTFSSAELERRFLQAVGENQEWFEAHRVAILQEHPDWSNQFVVVCSRTPSKVLAVSEYHSLALEKALESPELIEVAAREGVPPGCLIIAMTMSVYCTWGDE